MSNDWYDELPFTPTILTPKGRAGIYREEVEAYLQNPGKWRKLNTFKGAKARQHASNLVSGINRKDLAAFRTSGHWETARKVVSETEIEVWVRWLDTKDPAPKRVTQPKPKRTR